MAHPPPVKTSPSTHCRIVGVIAGPADLRRALAMSQPPDLFELRLDHLVNQQDELERKIGRLGAPLIITARHPAEGGANRLPARRRRELMARFLPHARYVDFELRSATSFRGLLDSPPRTVRPIISIHDFHSTPSPRSLHAKARAAKSYGASVFKVVTRTDTPAQLARLFEFMARRDRTLAVSAMGVGKLGAVARIGLARCGSVLVYGSLAQAQVEGQLSVEKLRAVLALLPPA
jgi:3-dehydroquinate dehydratase-1